MRGKLNEHGESRIIILGLDNAGKTAIFNSIKGSDTDYKELKPTAGFNTEKIKFKGVDAYENYTLDLWEIGGAEKVRPYWQRYCKDKDGIIFVVDGFD